jgi:hypothetical protein
VPLSAFKTLYREADLVQIVLARPSPAGFASHLDCGEKYGDERTNDRDNDH